MWRAVSLAKAGCSVTQSYFCSATAHERPLPLSDPRSLDANPPKPFHRSPFRPLTLPRYRVLALAPPTLIRLFA